MATTKEFHDYVIENLKVLDKIFCRPMMGEYLLYYDDILFGGIYDNRVLIKIVDNNKKYNLEEQIPYKGAKPMYMVNDLENKEYSKSVIIDTCSNLPRKKKSK